MKKGLAIVLLLLTAFLLVACGEVSAVEKQIEAIGTVTVDSEEAINAAQEAYDALPDEDKAKVENYAVLEEAHAQYALALTEQDYQAAVSVFEAGNYEDAKALFIALNGYKDSADKITACDYQLALGVLEAGNYEEAKELFIALDGYEDSADKITACDYQIALGVLEAGNYEEAKELFTALDGYEDSADRITSCQFMIAEQYFADGYLNTAKAMYSELPADFSYEGHSVEERLASLEKFNSFVELCGVWNCKTMNGSVRQTHDSTGIWDQWDAEGYNYKLTITCVLNDDETVTMTAKANFWHHTNYSSLSKNLKTTADSCTFVYTGTSVPRKLDYSLKLDAQHTGTLTIQNKTFALDYKILLDNYSVNFTYTFKSFGTYDSLDKSL